AVLPRLARAPRGDRRADAGVDAGLLPHAGGGGGALRRLAARLGGPVPGGGDPGAAHLRALPLAQPGGEPRRPARPGGRQRQGRGRGAGDDRPLRPRRRPRLHAPHPGQRRGGGAAGHRRAGGRRGGVRDRQRRPDRRHRAGGPRGPRGHDRLHRDDGPAGVPPQRARGGDHGSRALRAPHPGRRRPPAHLRIPPAAVLYVFRTLVADDIPLNDGCLRPLHLIVPRPSMLAPEHPEAVVGGNVETSQAVTGALYRALGVQAEGSGTMNNVTFGNARHQYYETVASGSGAGPGFHGTAVVQTHMTNSRLTDPEVLETRYPVLVDSFAVRRGSGGAGRWRGGDGAVRRLRFTEPMTVSLLTGHRRVPPYGMAGGEPGALGVNRVERADGTVTELAGDDVTEVGPGDVLVVETPGGGGYGTPA